MDEKPRVIDPMSGLPREDFQEDLDGRSQMSQNSQPPRGWAQAIRNLKERLIDTSKRNRLINTPIGKNRGKHLDIIDERSDEIFKILVHQNKKMYFDHSKDGYDEQDNMENIFIPDSGPLSAKHVDLKLQTRLTKDALHKRLLQLYRDSNSSVEEQGANPLFLALGFVRWFESKSSKLERFAPLVLLPVELVREGVRDNIKLCLRDQDLEPNHSFDSFLKSDFDLKLPSWPDGEDWLPSEYFANVNHLISRQENWRVFADTIQLGFYSSGKFLMSRDLDRAETTELMQQLLCAGFGNPPPLFDPDENLDERYIDPRDLGHIMEADASQTRVIAAAQEGRSMIVQGPPGTGKSQTIANIIAVSVRNHQTVLFVAEKRAALEVVHDRLESCGLGPLCLEMHSTKAQKKAVYQDLGETLKLGRPRVGDPSEYERLKAVRDELNKFSNQLHTVDEISGETPFGIIGQLTKLIGDSELPKPDYHVEETATWDPLQSQAAREQIGRLAELTRDYGPEGSHHWRGVNRKFTPMDRDRLNDKINTLHESLEELISRLNEASTALSISEDGGLIFVDKVLTLVQAFGSRPVLVDKLVRAEGVLDHLNGLQQLFKSIRRENETRTKLESEVMPSAFGRDWSLERRDISKHQASFFRWFNGPYRTAVKQVKSVAKKDLPKSNQDRLKLLDTLIHHQARIQEIDEQRSLGELAVGPQWRGFKTEVTEVIGALEWIGKQIELLGSSDALQTQMDQWPEELRPSEIENQLHDSAQVYEKRLDDLMQFTDLDVQQAFGEGSIRCVPLSTMKTRISCWQRDPEGQDAWSRLLDMANAVTKIGLNELRVRLAQGILKPDHAVHTYDYIRAEAVYRRFDEINPNLSRINGRERSSLVKQFVELDATLLDLSAQEVMSAHYESIPEGTRGEMGVLRGEVQKKSRHMPLRKLLREVGGAVQAIKPVFLMSPLSVAQYLDPEGLRFDLLLIDEASQVRPADAIGAMMRTSRAVIVGDQKQLPPTSFFEKLVNNAEENEDGQDLEEVIADQVKDMESILALCEARGMPGCMLKWHYRSQHESLITVSNHEFYENKLVCPPSPSSADPKLGLTFQSVDGIYRRGRGRSDNPIEAKAVMDAVLVHARTRPTESLGVVAMSQAQQSTIQNEAERMRAMHPELNSFCSETKENAFFVKNLETVQGDERDVIFISIGYGRTEEGRLYQNFGPVSGEGGERRLNVLFTRAKKRCRVFSSIHHTDIQHDKARHRGPFLLKSFLKYAETGEMDVPVITGRAPDSPFEEAVGDAIRGYGYKVDYQVGSEGFLIDLAVRDPDRESGYILAVECDGARYHSSYWARERDRMRQTLLEGKGWTFHRIWSTDWFHNPIAETQKVVDAIRQACVKTNHSHPRIRRPSPITRDEKPEELIGQFYEEFDHQKGDRYTGSTYREIQEASNDTVADLIVKIIEMEGPIHEDMVVRKTSLIWGYDRTGDLIKEKIQMAIDFLIHQGRVDRSHLNRHFLLNPKAKVRVRNRGEVKDTQLRKPEMIAPEEYRVAILDAVKRCLAINRKDCAIEVARRLGFKSTSETLKKRIITQVDQLLHEGDSIMQSNGIIRLIEVQT